VTSFAQRSSWEFKLGLLKIISNTFQCFDRDYWNEVWGC